MEGIIMNNIIDDSSYWRFVSAIGSLVHVSKDEYPTFISAIAEARRQLLNG